MVPELTLTPGQSVSVSLVQNKTGAPPRWPTQVELGYVNRRLVFRFTCTDEDIWSTMTERDDPLWDEEVVEVFLAPGEGTPTFYFEFEVNPGGILWDGRPTNPNGVRDGMESHAEWNSETIEWSAWKDEGQGKWGAEISVSLDELAPDGIPPIWRLNLYRIERPQTGGVEYSAWSPTMIDEFHLPGKFGKIRLAGL